MPRDSGRIDAQIQAVGRPGRVVLHCARCDAFVTRPDWAITMNGDHEHVVFNPAGMLFRIVCFRDAPGAVAMGAASGQFTWFKGYDWRVALCNACGSHLGWHYEGPDPPQVFFGLIHPMLVERRD